MSNKREYPLLEHTGKSQCPIMWVNTLRGSLGIYDKETDLIIVRNDVSEAHIRVGIAEALAAHDIAVHGPDPHHGTDARALAVSRLLPDQRFSSAYQTLGGGVTALARFFNVPPLTVRSKLDMLRSEPESARPRAD